MPLPKIEYSTEQLLQAIKDSLGSYSICAAKLGCCRTTAQTKITENEEAFQAFKDERARVVDAAESNVFIRAMEGDPDACKFVLGNLGRERGYGKQEVQLTGGVDVHVTVSDDILPEE